MKSITWVRCASGNVLSNCTSVCKVRRRLSMVKPVTILACTQATQHLRSILVVVRQETSPLLTVKLSHEQGHFGRVKVIMYLNLGSGVHERWNFVEILEFGWNPEIWSKSWNWVKILKFGWHPEIRFKSWNLVKILIFGQNHEIWLKSWSLIEILKLGHQKEPLALPHCLRLPYCHF